MVTTTPGRTFSALAHHNFRLWCVGQGISMVGYFGHMFALAILVLGLTDSGAVLGAVMALHHLPTLIVTPWAGVLCDRLEKRRLLVVTQTVMMLLALGLGALALSGRVSVAWVAVLSLAMGIAFAFDQPARRTIVVELVHDDAISNAVGLNGGLDQVAKLLGPAIAGVVASVADEGWCFIGNGLSSVAVLVSLTAMDRDAIRRSTPVARTRGQVVEGFRHAWADRPTRRVLGMLGVITFTAWHWNVMLPLLATRDLGGTTATVAMLTTGMSVGSLTGMLWLARRGGADEPALARGCVVFGLAMLGLGTAPITLVALPAVVIMGAAAMVFINGASVVVQLRADPSMRGRAMGIYSVVVIGGLALGAPLLGWIAESAGARVAIAFGALASLGAGLTRALPRGRL